MNTFSTIASHSLTLLCFITASMVQAQDFVPFGGRGIPDDSPIPYSNRATKRTGDSSQDGQPFRWFGGQGVMRPAKPREMEDRPRLFGSMFQNNDHDEPNFFERTSERTRDAWGRTKNWAHDQNQQFRERTAESWESLTRGLRPQHPDPPPSPNHGPVRMAENPDSRTDRF